MSFIITQQTGEVLAAYAERGDAFSAYSRYNPAPDEHIRLYSVEGNSVRMLMETWGRDAADRELLSKFPHLSEPMDYDEAELEEKRVEALRRKGYTK